MFLQFLTCMYIKIMNLRVLYSIIFYILLIVLLYLAKPQFIFDANGQIKHFGIGESDTMFSLGVFSVAIAFMSFYIFAVIDIIFDKGK